MEHKQIMHQEKQCTWECLSEHFCALKVDAGFFAKRKTVSPLPPLCMYYSMDAAVCTLAIASNPWQPKHESINVNKVKSIGVLVMAATSTCDEKTICVLAQKCLTHARMIGFEELLIVCEPKTQEALHEVTGDLHSARSTHGEEARAMRALKPGNKSFSYTRELLW